MYACASDAVLSWMGSWGAPTLKGTRVWGTAWETQRKSELQLYCYTTLVFFGIVKFATESMDSWPIPAIAQSFAQETPRKLQEAPDFHQEKTVRWNHQYVQPPGKKKKKKKHSLVFCCFTKDWWTEDGGTRAGCNISLSSWLWTTPVSALQTDKGNSLIGTELI